MTYLQRAMAATDDFEAQAFAMSAMGWLDLISGDARGALAWSEKGLALAEARGDWAMRAVRTGVGWAPLTGGWAT